MLRFWEEVELTIELANMPNAYRFTATSSSIDPTTCTDLYERDMRRIDYANERRDEYSYMDELEARYA